MKEKRSYKGTVIALIVIIILVLLSKFVFKEDFSQKDILVEPTEAPTVRFFEGTQLMAMPTE